MFEPEPDAGLIRPLRHELPAIKPAEIRAAVKRVRSAAPPEAVNRPPAEDDRTAREQGTPRGGKGGPWGKLPWGKVTLGDIISSGLLRPPVDLYRRYKGHDLAARIELDGLVSFGGRTYGSLSTAAQHARRSVIGEDKRAQTNGWTKDDAGQRQKPDALRQRLWESRAM